MRREERFALFGLLCGLFATVAAMALPYAYPDLPILLWRILLWSGLTITSFCFLFLVYDLFIKSLLLKPEKQITSKLILSLRQLEISELKDNLVIDLLFNNDGTKEFIIDYIFMIVPGNQLLTLDEHDNLLNNFNNKATLEWRLPDGKIIFPASYYGLGAIKSGFPRVIKSGELCPLKVNIPFIVKDFLKEKKLSNINTIPIGLKIHAINYNGEKYEIITYPIAELDINNDKEIIAIYYNSQLCYIYEIEKCNKLPSRVRSLIVDPGSPITPDIDTTDILEIKIK